MKRLICCMMLGAAIVVPCKAGPKPKGPPPPPAGTAILIISDGVNPPIIVPDNGSSDGSTMTGVITVTTNVGVWQQVIVSSVTKPSTGSATAPTMDTSVQAFCSGPGTLTVTFSDKNYGGNNGTATGLLTGAETGNLLSGAATVDVAVFGDGGNNVDALTSLIADAGPEVWPPALVFFPGSFALSQPFSLSQVVTIQASTSTHLNIDASLQSTLDQGSVGHCRVTGGSNHETNNSQSACITTPPPTFISHGGQCGAALSDETPFTPNDPCIGGSWEHNRHLTANSLVGTFHASGGGPNHNDFDSLLCACLPCDSTSVGVVGDVCNPKDKICGPSPAAAPANKICFSGVGEFTFTTGPKTVPAVFRVDIEDHGEGNSNANPLPRDRYRMRIWLLDPSCGRDPDPTTSLNMALRFGASADPNQIANVLTTENLKDPTIGPPDIDDGGTMTQGNHQIHFATGATCQ